MGDRLGIHNAVDAFWCQFFGENFHSSDEHVLYFNIPKPKNLSNWEKIRFDNIESITVYTTKLIIA